MASTTTEGNDAAAMATSESDKLSSREDNDNEETTNGESSTIEALNATKVGKTKHTANVVRVGVGVVVQDPLHPNKVFCGVRKGSHGAGTLSLPGGHLELYESWEACAAREVSEEMNIQLNKSTLRLCYVSNDPMPNESKHYVTIFMMGKQQKTNSGGDEDGGNNGKEEYPRPINMEPDKCEGWDSYTIQELKEKEDVLFGPLKRLLTADPSSLHEFLSQE